MAELKVEIEPTEAGFAPDRLARIDRRLARYVDDGRLPGWLVVVSRDGRVVHLGMQGQRDVEAGRPIQIGTVFRIGSMTKPITSVAALMLYEEGGFELKDPVGRFVPSFKDVRVYRRGSAARLETDPVVEPVRIWHLLTHTSGLTYGFRRTDPVDALYRAAGFDLGAPPGMDLAAGCDALAQLPLLFEPGTEWNYGMSTDVLGRVIEVVSGQALDEFLTRRVFEPLGMTDTAFWVADSHPDRVAVAYAADPADQRPVRDDTLGKAVSRRPEFLMGGGGLLSTAADYHRFTQMLLRGGELDGVRLLGSRMLRYMTQNHLPRGVDLETFGRPIFPRTYFDGVGFGLGVSVLTDPTKNKVLRSAGEFGWGGVFNTYFWVDPIERITALFLAQVLMSPTQFQIRPQLHQLVNQALID
jgi:CubicO group peptidase (beta-lactamase class C family)